MNKLDKQYQDLLKTILEYGVEKEDRTGTGTKSIFGYTIRHNMQDGFPLMTTKKMAIKTMMTELKWFLKGDTNIKYLVDNGCNIWNGDAYTAYSISNFGKTINTEEQFIERIKTDDEFAMKWGDLGPIYGKQWTDWNGIDQILNLINSLKKNPDSRRLMVSAWNVGELHEMTLPPCHYGFQVYTRELTTREMCKLAGVNYDEATQWTYHTKNIDADLEIRYMLSDKDVKNIPTRAISLMWNQRSVDTFLGLPFNISSYATLLTLLAEEVNMVPDQLIGNLGDTHLYSNHLEQAKEQIERTSFELPQLKLSNVDILNGEFDYEIIDYQSHPSIKAPLSN